ncbi:DUF305 domain-containing protein [Thermomonospora cellulosilytica]|uniref:Uncharacterized protein (DUF305 family) n=1 Tax=Thermomonospora cellulosilytica TaxID=1411118 RepID=A0A7W3R7R1_9ACTN|nr:DUF305 domain-containing protein [Thermomonospora cellulosilytica]MBA9002804.1 uncharacterized protein (DUF305 family) [Thermomonospora cellulosilytica]
MKRALALIVVPVAAFSLAACGGDDSGDSTSAPSATTGAPTTGQAQTGRHNDQDITFAQMMIPHHQQAIEMSRLAATRASSPEVKQLAADIEKAQDPEIRQMTAWLNSWGASVPSPGTGGMGHGDHGGHGGMDGMMTEEEMRKLENAGGAAFDKMFLEMMIKHHEGAVAMARTEQSAGQYPPAKAMATSIVNSQTTEITKMRDLLKSL